MENILKTTNLKKYYGSGDTMVKALDGINLEIERGTFTAIIGTSGSGKSTLLNMLGGLDTPTQGSIRIGNTELEGLNSEQAAVFRRKQIGFIFQNYNLIPVLTVWENIIFPLSLDAQKPDRQFIMQVVKLLGLENKLDALPGNLSGGQQQRVAIARALVKMPKVLLLDEPLSNLDARLRLQTREEIRRIQKATKITTIFVTHDQEEAMSISDMIVVMKEGVVQQIGKPQEVYDNPANLFVARFLGTPPINVFDGEIKGSKLYIGQDAVLDIKGSADREVHVGIRPEGFVLKEDGPLCCQLSGVEVMGRDISVVSTHAASLNPTVRSIIGTDNRVDGSQEKVRFALLPRKVFLFDKQTQERIDFDV